MANWKHSIRLLTLQFFRRLDDNDSLIFRETLQVQPTRRERQSLGPQHHTDHPRAMRKAVFKKIGDPDRVCAGLCGRFELLPANVYTNVWISQDVPVPISTITESRGNEILSIDLLVLQRCYSGKSSLAPRCRQQENQFPNIWSKAQRIGKTRRLADHFINLLTQGLIIFASPIAFPFLSYRAPADFTRRRSWKKPSTLCNRRYNAGP